MLDKAVEIFGGKMNNNNLVDKLTIGESASFSKTITESDVSTFAGLTGDLNPMHINNVVANHSIFGGRIAHGMLSASFISAVLGTKLPGEGTIYLSQNLNFLKPVKIGDTVTAICTVKDVLNAAKGVYRIDTKCVNQNGEMVVNGEAVVKYAGGDSEKGKHRVSGDNKARNLVSQDSFYSQNELSSIGLASYGKNCKISRNAVLYNPEQLSIGNNVRIDDFTTISGKVVLGDYIHIAQFCGLYGGSEGIFMDDFSGLSSRVVVYATSNDYSGKSLTNPTVPMRYKDTDQNSVVRLGKHVVVGTTSVILPGVNIGIGCSVGSMSMISKDCEPWGIYAGSPARRIKERSQNLLELEKQLRVEEKIGGVEKLRED